jgi:hypothetical protein
MFLDTPVPNLQNRKVSVIFQELAVQEKNLFVFTFFPPLTIWEKYTVLRSVDNLYLFFPKYKKPNFHRAVSTRGTLAVLTFFL